jgi:Myb DNA-binding like
MSTHTTVSASVIKSTSRFAPKAVPRKVQPPRQAATRRTSPPRGSESDEEVEDEEQEEVDEQEEDVTVKTTENGIPTIQSSYPTTISPPTGTVTPIPIPTVLSSSTLLPAPIELSQPEPVPTTSTRKRRATHTANTDPPTPRRSRRKATPPTAEEVVIVPATATMSEMCVDKRTGRKSARYEELRAAERQRRRDRELKRERAESGSVDPTGTDLSEIVLPERIPEEDDMLLPVQSGTARVITDEEGNIVIDQASLQVDRHEIHPSTLTESLIHTDETIFSKRTNSASYSSTRNYASNKIRWLPSDDERFYTALRMFGTDFELIATYMGDGKSRRHVKNKFDREERKNSDKLTWALKNRLEVDVAGLEEKYGTKFKKKEEIAEELEGLRAEARLVMAMPAPSSENQNPGDRPKGVISAAFDD